VQVIEIGDETLKGMTAYFLFLPPTAPFCTTQIFSLDENARLRISVNPKLFNGRI
jgi:hypothetical protein